MKKHVLLRHQPLLNGCQKSPINTSFASLRVYEQARTRTRVNAVVIHNVITVFKSLHFTSGAPQGIEDSLAVRREVAERQLEFECFKPVKRSGRLIEEEEGRFNDQIGGNIGAYLLDTGDAVHQVVSNHVVEDLGQT